MKIASSELQLSSQHSKLQKEVEHERFRVWVGNPGGAAGQTGGPAGMRAQLGDQVNLSARAQQAQPVKKQVALEDEHDPLVDAKMQALVNLIERLTGKKMEFFDPQALQGKTMPPHTPSDPNPQQAQREGFGIEYDYYHARIEEEHTRFQAQGRVQTSDGRQIDIQLELGMSRRFMEEQSISLRVGDAQLKDPLVLNFDGMAAELSETTFSFDLDSDGREDQIVLLEGDRGFLALDKNADGQINDGSELFGAQSGNGFADLAAYDEDGNRWIDEADSVYSKLRVWTRDAAGNDQLFALGQKDVGAIYLGHVSTPFEIKDSDNNLQGEVASSGLFLKESGGAGTVQQLNLVV